MKSEYIWQVMFVLVGALASAYAGYWFGNQPDESSIIEYRSDSTSNLQSLMGGNNKLKITYEGRSLDALSSTSFQIANTSEKNLDKVKIYFELEDKSNSPIFHTVSPQKVYPKEAVTLISEKNGVYVFELEYLNRTDSIWDGIAFSFYFGGSDSPKINVKTGTKGVSIRQYTNDNISASKIFVRVIVEVWWFLLIYLSGGYLFYKYRKAERVKKENLFKSSIAAELADQEGKSEAEIVENILKVSKREPSFKETLKSMFGRNNA
ncbi:hypothetical protein [Marinobacterium sedimentorum]|uniref:hypothetical protein n=1 Tax=Marinobacterium sedimentorum TaxID=2927804 RepID=UPI0020C721ED|nr:hypothetical protein [Marinobacterium sedimentorum]MCP8688923.1 hypothetical protein [Marinobacterium sedimentorum]